MESLFIVLKEYGRVDENGKRIISIGLKPKPIIAQPDRPLLLIGRLINQLQSSITYSSDEAAATDIELFKKFVETLRPSMEGNDAPVEAGE